MIFLVLIGLGLFSPFKDLMTASSVIESLNFFRQIYKDRLTYSNLETAEPKLQIFFDAIFLSISPRFTVLLKY